MAGLQFEVFATLQGLTFRFAGYNEKLCLFVERIFGKLVSFSISPERFHDRKQLMQREFENFQKEQAWDHARYELENCLLNKKWTIDQKLATFPSITLETLSKFLRKELFKFVKLEWLVMGNLVKQEAQHLVQNVEKDYFASSAAPASGQIEDYMRVVELNSGSKYILRKQEYNADNPNSATYRYYQVGLETIETMVKLNFLAHLGGERAFDQLRTKEQLGYIVWLGIREANGVCGFRVIVQSSTYDAKYVAGRIEEYVKLFKTQIEGLKDDEFEEEKNGLLVKMSEKDKKLADEVKRYWAEICKHKYLWNSRDLSVNFLKEKVGKKEVLELFDEFVDESAKKRCVLSVELFGAGKKFGQEEEEKDGKVDNHGHRVVWIGEQSYVDFKNAHRLFPLNT